jgi:hypothetical protein
LRRLGDDEIGTATLRVVARCYALSPAGELGRSRVKRCVDIYFPWRITHIHIESARGWSRKLNYQTNKFFATEGKINSLLDILKNVELDTSKFSEKNLKLYEELTQAEVKL